MCPELLSPRWWIAERGTLSEPRSRAGQLQRGFGGLLPIYPHPDTDFSPNLPFGLDLW